MAALAASVAAATDPQQTQQPPQPPQPTFRTEANYVRVDVYPTRDGVPVADLTQDDFEILEERAPQKIDQFEHVVIRGNIPQEMRREPNSVAESRAAIQNPRARVFVVFLDIGHVDVGGSHNIRQPLIDTLNRVIGEEDLVAVMTPGMSALDLTFARKTTTIEGFLTRQWTWGDRDKFVLDDPVEKNYEACFGPYPTTPLTQAVVNRRREKMTLDALTDLVVYLRGAREERKAVIAITDGWVLYGPDGRLQSTLGTPPAPGLNPGTGKLQIGDKNVPNTIGMSDCQRDLMMLASIDDAQEYRRLLDAANAANTSFYPIDPRGLAVFDSPISQPLPLQVDSANLRTRSETLRTLAESTDGIAIIQNDLAGGLRRIVDDVSSYYLLGYYSNGKLDGRFHSITVRVKRPGVQVRARRGYLAASPQSINAAAATAAATAAKTAAEAESHAMDGVLSPLAAFAREMPIRVQAATGWKPGGGASVWLVGELGSSEEWKSGADADVTLTNGAGATLATAHATVPMGTIGPRTFRVTLSPTEPLAPGEYTVRVRARGAASSMATNETTHVLISASPEATGAIFIRRGPATGNREVATADLRFRRSEQVRVEVPATAGGTARLLDRTGKALAVPVIAAVRDDADGSQWQTAQLALAPLAPGDYVIELSTAGGARTVTKTLVAFRVVP